MVSEINATVEKTEIWNVLILVVVEDGLGGYLKIKSMHTAGFCLNPCCGGRWSRRHANQYFRLLRECVLILVVVEDGLGGEWRSKNFNPLVS